MSDLVDRTLKLWRRTPFVYGFKDCLLSIGDYAAAAGYINISDQFRGTYDDEFGAAAIVDQYGGEAALIDLIGLPRIDPEMVVRGDIVLWNTGEERIGAICTGDGVAGRSRRTVFELAKRFVTIETAWKI